MQLKTADSIRTVVRCCPLCGTDNTAVPITRYSDSYWRLKTCPVCIFVYIENAPQYQYLTEEMAWEKRASDEEQRRTTEWGRLYRLSKRTRWRLHILPRKRIAYLLSRHAEPGNVVDLGCGEGYSLHGLGKEFIPHGIEISTALYQRANKAFARHGGYAVHAPCLEGLQQFPDGYFSAATLRSYLEHELRPAAVLRELGRALKPGGVAIVKVPNYGSLNRRVRGRKWCGFRFPDHLNYFTPTTLRAMGERLGFKVNCGLTYRLPTSDNMYAVFTRP